MGFLSNLLGRTSDTDLRYVDWLGPTFREMILGLTPEELYRTQPHLRIVLSFVARNVAHLGLKAYARAGDNDRRRLKDDPLALLLKHPNPSMTQFELLESLASDLGLYDVAYWWLVESTEMESGWLLQPIPPSWVTNQRGGTAFAPERYEITNPNGTRTEVPARDMIVFHGWNPGRPKHGTSPVQTLKQVLAEQVQAWSYREQVWQRGGRVGAFITRPKDAQWSDAARERFARDWKDRWTGKDGKKAGGTPILEDGMELKRLGFSAREDEWSEVAKLALSTVAAVYHVNPVMVGILDNANFSNTREFRKMLYSETLGPTLARLEDRINTFLVPRVAQAGDAYVEFNIEEKLQGDFEEQAKLLSTSTGAPWMTRNEARGLRNLPAIDGGDELVVPLNVLVGGQASPHDSGTQNESAAIPPAVKSPERKVRLSAVKAAAAPYEPTVEATLRGFFAEQKATVLSRLGAKDPDWWDGDRWNAKLADALHTLALKVTKALGEDSAERLGFSPSDYDVDRTRAFLREVAKSRAGAINAATVKQIQAVLDGTGPEGAESPAHVFKIAESSRAHNAAVTLTTTLAAFAAVEAARQKGAGTKTWLVTSSKPRPAHAAVNGETVGIDDTFSNGAKWPGDPVLGADGVAGCTCDVEVTFG